MNSQKIESIKDDFRLWSGGFAPDSEEQITVYLDYSCPLTSKLDDIRRMLRDWRNHEFIESSY